MKFGVIGDTHGDTHFLVDAIGNLRQAGVTHALVLGDFGIFPHLHETYVFLDKVNAALMDANMLLIAIRGNHDSTDWWRAQFGRGVNRLWHRNAHVRSNIVIAPDINHFKLDGKTFYTINGAVSIDISTRLQMERNSGPRTRWWPDEGITDEQVRAVRNTVVANPFDPESKGLRVDYLFSHQCSNATPFGGGLIPDFESERDRERFDEILHHLKPRKAFHGHMHRRYEWENTYHMVKNGDFLGYFSTDTFGLDCNGMWDSWGILDTQTDEFMWRGVSNG